MKSLKRICLLALIVALATFAPSTAFAATSPDLGFATTFGILSSSYVNTASGPPTTINGDLGYTTGPAVTPTVNGNTHAADSTYNQAGIDQGVALSALASQPCTFTFAPGAIDLASDTTHGTVGVYDPGVYCITGAASVGGGGSITMTGSGTYIFRMTGALTTTSSSVITTASGASACNIWWTPDAATTLGANSTFTGTVIDPSGITIGDLVTWEGKALAFGGTVSTSRDTITAPSCATSSPPGSDDDGGDGGSGTNTPGLPNTGGGMLALTDSQCMATATNRMTMHPFIKRLLSTPALHQL